MKSAPLLLAIGLIYSASGCTPPANDNDANTATDVPIVMDALPPTMDEHAHPEHGPHGGELVEIGGEAMHIEWVHAGDGVDFYVLDAAATEPVAIAATHLTVSLKHDGAVKSFQVDATPQSGDSDGNASRYVSKDAELEQWLEAGAEGAVTLQVDGKSFTGEIHHHDH